jgi:hypothetical protein
MSEVQELEMRIRNLPSADRALLRDWFYEFDNELWDRQIQDDFKAGRFASLIDEARKEFSEGQVREL